MSKTDDYRQSLKKLDDWIPFLKKESGLPGPRGNLELAYAVVEEGSKEQFENLLLFRAEENTPEVFLVFCGVVGLGKLAAGEPKLFDQLREYASDPRWRIREAVATGLQLTGDQDMAGQKYPMDDEGKLEKESLDQDGRELGQDVQCEIRTSYLNEPCEGCH